MSIFALVPVQILLIKRPLLQSSPTSQSDIRNMTDKEPEKCIESVIGKMRRVHLGRRISNAAVSTVLSFVVTAAAQSERINQEGRILGPAPAVTTPTLFNTSQADAIVSAMQIFPVTNPWNEDISRRPLLSNSATMISQMKSDLSSSRQTLRPFYEMNYVLVPDNQARVTVPLLDYPDESDLDGGTFPNGS